MSLRAPPKRGVAIPQHQEPSMTKIKHEHLMKPFQDFLRDREKVLTAIVQIEVAQKHGCGISGNPADVETVKEHPEEMKKIYDGMKALLENALAGKYPTEEELQKPASFDGEKGRELILRLAEWLKFASHLLEAAKEQDENISVEKLGEDEFRNKMAELQLEQVRHVSEMFRQEREYIDRVTRERAEQKGKK